MSSILTSVLLSAGKHLIGEVTGSGNNTKKIDRAEQLARFDQRLDSVVNPDKTAFKTFLDENHIVSKPGLEYLKQRLQDGLLADPEMADFLNVSGTFDDSLTIEKTQSGYTLMNASGEVLNVDKGSMAGAIVGKLYRIESVLQLAAVDPTLDLNKAIEMSFEADDMQPVAKVTVSTR